MASDQPAATITGISASPSLWAASTRPWPAMIVPASSTSTGIVHPHSRIEAAIWATCSSEWVRAFRAYGTRAATGRRSTASAGHLASVAATAPDSLPARRLCALLAVIVALQLEAPKRALSWRYWQTGKILCVSPRAVARPRRPQGSEAPRPACRALGALIGGFFRHGERRRAATRSTAPAARRRLSAQRCDRRTCGARRDRSPAPGIARLLRVARDRATRSMPATSRTCPRPWAAGPPCCRFASPHARLQRLQSHDRVAPNKAIE